MSNKRKHDDVDVDKECDKPSVNSDQSSPASSGQSRKGTVQEGFSWWTALMYDMPQQMTKPHLVQKSQNEVGDNTETLSNLDHDITMSSDLEDNASEALKSVINKSNNMSCKNKNNFPPEETSNSDYCVPCISDLEIDLEYPPEPQEPSDSDCCGSGCVPCVFDIYEQEIKIWKEECRKIKLGKSADHQIGPVLSVEAYNKFVIGGIIQESHDTFRYHVNLPDYQSLGLSIGQHIILRGQVDGQIITRQYTPISDVKCQGHFDLLIKIYKDGLMSRCIKSWQIDTTIEIRGPYGNLTYAPNKYKHLFMLAAGTGIAPMSQVIQGVLNNEDDYTMIHLIYGCKTYDDILLKTELKDWSQYWNFSVLYALSQEPINGSKYCYGDRIHADRTMPDIIRQEFFGALLSDSDAYLVLICGTRSFDKDMQKYCTEMEISEEKKHKF